jgi:hypothetical protein
MTRRRRVDTPAPDQLTNLDVWLERQQSRLADVRDRIARVAMQQIDVAAQLRWLDTQLAQFRQTITRGTDRP